MKKVFCVFLIALFLPVFSFSDESVINPVGRWTIFTDYSEMADNYLFSKTDFLFFEDGTIHLVSVKKDKHDDLSISSASGIWLSDPDTVVARINDHTYNFTIDGNGFLLLLLGDEAHLTFSRVGK